MGVILSNDNTGNITVAFKYDPYALERHSAELGVGLVLLGEMLVKER